MKSELYIVILYMNSKYIGLRGKVTARVKKKSNIQSE
jgi:hypothetical protein